jgi:selenocysteine-specific elongation factor
MIIGTAGHVDHGKTALVKALTGIDADRLPGRRGITIDLGYAYTDAFGFADASHERFVHTMLAGASGVDAALLVVALDVGVMPQTRERADPATMASIAAVASPRPTSPRRDTDAALRCTLLETALAVPLPPASAMTVPASRPCAACSHSGRDNGCGSVSAALVVDRRLTLAGAGLVVVRTLVVGRIRVEDRLMLSPPGIDCACAGPCAEPAGGWRRGSACCANVTGPRLSKDAGTRRLGPASQVCALTAADIRLIAGGGARARADAPVHLHSART